MRHIKVLIDFGGKETQERRILPGEYEESDPALFGLADYLVANGYAVSIELVGEVSTAVQGADESAVIAALDTVSDTTDAAPLDEPIPTTPPKAKTKKR